MRSRIQATGDHPPLPSYRPPTRRAAGRHSCVRGYPADTLNIDERLIEAAITPRTRAIFPIHYAGVACEMDEIMAIAQRHNLLVVEDAAQGVFAKYKGRWLGTIGHMGCYSFHETKNFSCGEGGALTINDPRLEKRAEILREKGTNRSQFLRGQVDKYTWSDIGSSYVPSDMLAAFLLGQLENMEKITARRGEIFSGYASMFAPLVESGLIRTPFMPQHCTPNYHMFYLVAANRGERTADRASTSGRHPCGLSLCAAPFLALRQISRRAKGESASNGRYEQPVAPAADVL